MPEKSRLGDNNMVALSLGDGKGERIIAVIPPGKEDDICGKIDECTLPEGDIEVLGVNVINVASDPRSSSRSPRAG